MSIIPTPTNLSRYSCYFSDRDDKDANFGRKIRIDAEWKVLEDERKLYEKKLYYNYSKERFEMEEQLLKDNSQSSALKNSECNGDFATYPFKQQNMIKSCLWQGVVFRG